MRVISKPHRATASSSTRFILVGTSVPSGTGSILGGFTLPVGADWEGLGLPAGDYRLVVPAAASRSWVHVRGDEGAAVIRASSIERAPGAPMSELLAMNQEYLAMVPGPPIPP